MYWFSPAFLKTFAYQYPLESLYLPEQLHRHSHPIVNAPNPYVQKAQALGTNYVIQTMMNRFMRMNLDEVFASQTAKDTYLNLSLTKKEEIVLQFWQDVYGEKMALMEKWRAEFTKPIGDFQQYILSVMNQRFQIHNDFTLEQAPIYLIEINAIFSLEILGLYRSFSEHHREYPGIFRLIDQDGTSYERHADVLQTSDRRMMLRRTMAETFPQEFAEAMAIEELIWKGYRIRDYWGTYTG